MKLGLIFNQRNRIIFSVSDNGIGLHCESFDLQTTESFGFADSASLTNQLQVRKLR